MQKRSLTFLDADLEKRYRHQLQPYLFKFFTCEITMLILLGLVFFFFGWEKEKRTQLMTIGLIILIAIYFLLWIYFYFNRSRLEIALPTISFILLIFQVWFSNPNNSNIYLVFINGGNIMMVLVIQMFALEYRVFVIYNFILMLSRITYGFYLGYESSTQQTCNIIILHLIYNLCLYQKELKQREFFLLSIKNNQLEQAFGLLQNEPYTIFQYHQDTLEFKPKLTDLHLFVADQETESDQQRQLLQLHQFLRTAKVLKQTLEQFLFEQIKEIPLSQLFELKVRTILISYNKKKFEVKIVQIYQECLTFYLTILTKDYQRNKITGLQERYQQFKAKYLSMFESVTQTNLKLLLNKSNPLQILNKLAIISLEVLIFFKLTHMEDLQPKQIELANFIKDILDKYSFGNITLINYQNLTIKSYPTLLSFYFLFLFTVLKQNTRIYIKIINEINDNIQVIIYKDFKIKQSKPFKVLESYLLFDKRIVPNESTTYVFTQEPKIPFSQNLFQDLKNQQFYQ